MPRRLFIKGEPRPANAGRRLGTPNKSTQDIGIFCREIFENEAFKMKWRNYFLMTPIEQMEPKLLVLLFAYAYGRPREQVEVSGDGRGPVRFTLDLGSGGER